MRTARFAFGFWLVSMAASTIWAQQYVISTLAGGGALATPAAALSVPIPDPQGGAVDASGNLYFIALNAVLKLDKSGTLTRAAGNTELGHAGDGGLATNAQLYSPGGIALDGSGNLFISDTDRIRRVSPSGIITTVAGGGTAAPGDGGPATSAQLDLSFRSGVAVDGSGNLFFSESYQHSSVRKVSPSGIITTVAGNGTMGYSGDGGPATAAQLGAPQSLALDNSGNLFIADGIQVRKVAANGIITTFAGVNHNGFGGDGGPATSAQLYYPTGLAVDGSGNLFISDVSRIRKVSSAGIISTVAGTATFPAYASVTGDGGPATAAQLGFANGVAVDSSGNLFMADFATIREVSSATGIINAVAGTGSTSAFSGDGGPATSAQLNSPSDVAVDGAGNVFVADFGNSRVRKISPNGIITTVAGNGACASIQGSCGAGIDGAQAAATPLVAPWGVAVDGAGNLFIAEAGTGRVRKVTPDGTISTAAGTSPGMSSGDGGPATSAVLNQPARVAVDANGNLFVMTGVDVRKVSPDGIITTVAGNGKIGFSGDGGPATSASIDPWDPGGCDGPGGGMAVDGAGDLVFADSYNARVREVSPRGTITTVAGTALYNYPGDGGPATSASLNEPFGVAFDGTGDLLIAELGGNRIRRVSTNGTITTLAGTGSYISSGDGGPAIGAGVYSPSGIAVDGAGNIYVAEAYGNTIRVLRPTSHNVLISAVLDAASQKAVPLSPGQLVTIYGIGLGPSTLVQNPATNGEFSMQTGGTTVSFNGIAAPVLYASGDQVGVTVPFAISGSSAQVTVTYGGETSAAVTVPVAPAAPSLFTANESGAGQAGATNADGTKNTAANPVKIGGIISLYATGSGQTSPVGVDGKLGGSTPILPVKVTIGGIPATVQYSGGAPSLVAGVIQVNVQVPSGVQPGGYVPVVLQVGDASTTAGAVWIAVVGN